MSDQGPSSSALKVVVIGGTHGNEYTGVWCVRALADDRRCTTMLGNPQAIVANVRFIDDDLNRQFRSADLQKLASSSSSSLTSSVEGRRAHELNMLLGPKESPRTDLVIDLHTTTCNMGLVLFIAEGDPLMSRVAAYITRQIPHDDRGRKTRIVIHGIPDRAERPNLCSLAKHSLTIEVGPVPQGLLRHDAADLTIRAVRAALDYLEHPCDDADLPDSVECFLSAPAVQHGEMSNKIQWPIPPSGANTLTSGLATPNIPNYMIHKDRQDRDFELVCTGDPLFVYHDGTVIAYSGSHGDEVYLFFINGAGYYYEKSGNGISVASKSQLQVATATCVGAVNGATTTAYSDMTHSH